MIRHLVVNFCFKINIFLPSIVMLSEIWPHGLANGRPVTSDLGKNRLKMVTIIPQEIHQMTTSVLIVVAVEIMVTQTRTIYQIQLFWLVQMGLEKQQRSML